MKAYEAVLAHIEQQILSGKLVVGSVLTPERDLAQQLGVSRTAVREALRTLQAQGLITSQVGAGPNSGTRIADAHSPALGKLLQMHVALSQFPIDDVVDARIMLERRNVELAAAHASLEDLAKLGIVLASMEDPQIGLDQFNRLDTAFHVGIAELGGNQLVIVLTTAVRQALAGPIKQASMKLTDYATFRADLIRQHRGVFEAVASREPARAADLIEEHIRHAYSILPMPR
ncbi:MAG: FadR family transcriptional regulator [Brooklawnia sp.]|nr:FadR family transcriptional regulator [Brooklawnia sp.]